MQIRIIIVYILDIQAPIFVFVNFVQKQMGCSVRIKIVCQIAQAVGAKPQVVQRGIKDILHIRKTFFDVLKQQCAFPHASGSFYSNQP